MRTKEVLSVGTMGPLLTQDILACFQDVPLDVFSYSMELGHTLRSFLKARRSEMRRCLLVAVHQDLSMSTWCFDGDRLLFWRPWPKNPQIAIESQLKSAVLDTIRYLEKLSIDVGALAFFMEGKGLAHGLHNAFPEALLFDAQDLAPNTPEIPHMAFTQLLLSQKMGKFPIKKMRPMHYMAKRYGAASAHALFMAGLSYLVYDCGVLVQKNISMSRHLERIEEKFVVLRKELEHMPLSYDQAARVKKLIESSLCQQERLWRFVDTMPDILGETIRLHTLLLGPQKACFSMESHDTLIDIKEVLQTWNRILPDHNAVVVDSHTEPRVRAVGNEDIPGPLVLECQSPLREDAY